MKSLITLIGIVVLVLCVLYIVKRVLMLFLWRRKGAATVLHDDLADAAEDIAGASRIAAALFSLAGYLIAPAGLLAIAVALGLGPKPLIVVLLPLVLASAVGAAALSAAAKLYAKAQRRKASRLLKRREPDA
jgi:hypothetical protein